MRYSIHIPNASAKFIVPAIEAVMSGTWNATDAKLLRPDPAAIRAALPAKWRKAAERWNGCFWHDAATDARWNGERFTGHVPFATLRDSRNKRTLCTIYAIPTE